ncbi:bactoprenol glucosyl transferase [Lachnospiraceae bacterium KM106-2]|nr:bactoprenol glucosyl transferase [Lachnospiraceae bacterium KM106-2]
MNSQKSLCSIVVPCFNEEKTIPIFYTEVNKVISQIEELTFEFIFIDDGSNDHTLEEMKQLKSQRENVHYISFSRNFGKEAAIYAGLEHAKGEYVTIMDVDLQDPPELLLTMYKEVMYNGYDCAAARRTTREGEPPIRSFFARMFYKIINKMSQVDIVDGARDYRFMSRQVVDAILSLGEYGRFSKGIFGWVGFKVKWLEYKNVERVEGETKWSFWKLFKYSIDGIVAFTTAPLALASIVGVIFCLLALIMVFFVFVRAMIHGDRVAGWPSLVCIITFLGGIQLFCAGISGIYLSKTYLETKKRPKYIAKEEK